MRRTATLIACLLLVGAGGCSDGGGDSPESKPSATAAPSQSVDPVAPFMESVGDAHLDSYATGIPAYQELEVFPPEWCTALDEGHSVEWMFDMSQGGLYPVGEDWGTAKPDAYELVVLGVKAYCPEHLDVVRKELRESGAY